MIKREEIVKWVEDKNINLNSEDERNWIHSTTLGGKVKSFWWKIDGNFNLYVKRKFKNSESMIYREIVSEDLEKIDSFMNSMEWIDLANSVSKLKDGTERDGLGKFLYMSLNWTTQDAQLASHLGAIFSLTGSWDFNGRKKGIQFRKNNLEWKESVMAYYLDNLSDEI